MTQQTLYRDVLLDHYRHPRNRGDLSDCDVVRRGSNPRCGDDIEVGLRWSGSLLEACRFHGRGCSVCVASASMMTEVVQERDREALAQLVQAVMDWVQGNEHALPDPALEALEAVRNHSARQKCLLLCWQALRDALDA